MWFVGTVRYRAGVEWETAGGITPQRTGTGDDFDTFFNPDGSVVVSGTTGGISIWSWRASQRAVVGGTGPLTLLTGYRLRVDRANWQLGHSATTRNGALISAHDTIDREYTDSQMHQILTAIQWRPLAGRAWQAYADVDIAPVVASRLVVQLPDKHPGADLVFLAKGGAATIAVSLARGRRPVPFTVTAHVLRTWNYRATARLDRNAVGVRITIY